MFGIPLILIINYVLFSIAANYTQLFARDNADCYTKQCSIISTVGLISMIIGYSFLLYYAFAFSWIDAIILGGLGFVGTVLSGVIDGIMKKNNINLMFLVYISLLTLPITSFIIVQELL